MAKSSLFHGRCGKRSHIASSFSVPPQRKPKTSLKPDSRKHRLRNSGAAERPDKFQRRMASRAYFEKKYHIFWIDNCAFRHSQASRRELWVKSGHFA
jgi:hypothetical protein